MMDVDVSDDFPLSCAPQIFSFLELGDVLRFGSCSKTCLDEAIREVEQRRKWMTQQYAYPRNWKMLGGSTSARILHCRDVPRDQESDWIPIPSTKDRVKQLKFAIPSDHPLRSAIYELEQQLRTKIDVSQAQSLVEKLKLISRAHKLHAAILRGAMSSNPIKDEYTVHSNPHEQERTCTLTRYIGDVLCIAYLLDHSNLHLVEGGPTSNDFLVDIRKQNHETSCYKSWVYLHSSILRLKPFTRDERARLGIPEFGKVSEMLPNDCYINDWFMSSEMSLVFSEFGPLGATFRQRDLVRVREIPARRLFAFLITHENHLRGETTRSALEWLCNVHEEARKRRPMTVREPVVRLCSGN